MKMEFDIWNDEPRYIKCIDKYSTPSDTKNWERLKVGEIYVFSHSDIRSWYTDVYLEDFCDQETGKYLHFNSVLFEEVSKEELKRKGYRL